MTTKENEPEAIGPDDAECDMITSPEWMRRGDVRRVFAVGHDVLDDWAADGLVEAHKLHPGRNGTVIYSVGDIRRAIRNSPIYFAVKREVEQNKIPATA